MLEDLHSHVVHDLLARVLQRICLQGSAQELQDQEPNECRRNDRESTQVARRDVSIDRDLGKPRKRDLQHRFEKNQEQRKRHELLVRPEIRDQPAHQARVVSFSEDFFVVHVVLKELNAVLARAFQLFFQQLPLVQFGIVTVAGE